MKRKIGEMLTNEELFKVTLCLHCYLLCLLPLTHILRDAAPGYHFASNRQKVNHLLFLDDLKLYASNAKSLESLIQTVHVFSNEIRDGIWSGKMYSIDNEERKDGQQ